MTSFLPNADNEARNTAADLQRIAATLDPPARTTFATVTQTKGWGEGQANDL